MLLRIRLLRSVSTTRKCYGKGEHWLAPSLANYFVRTGLAVMISKIKPKPVPKIKDAEITKKVKLKEPKTEEKTNVQAKHSNSSNSVGRKRRRPKNPSKGKS